MSKRYSAPLGASLIVLSSFFYASYGIWTKLMGDSFQGYTASALRSVLVLAFLFPIAIIYHHLEPIRIRENWSYLLGMFIASLFTWGPLYYAILHAGVGISLAVTYASIVISTFFFGWLFGREHFTRDKALSAVIGIVGLALIFSPTASHIGWTALLGALISGLSAGANSVFSKRIHYGATQSTIALWLASVLANFLMVLVLGEHRPQLTLHVAWIYLILFAIASVTASWSFVRGLKLIDAGAAGILGLLEIVFGVLFGVIFFHEHPTVVALLGMAVVIGAASIPYIKDSNAKRGFVE